MSNGERIGARYRGKRRTARGSATAEAVVALPVLVLLFVSVYYFRALSTARHESATQARSCAWLYSAGNCEAVPAGCEGVLDDRTRPDDDGGEVTRTFEEGQDTIRHGQGSGDVGSGMLDSLLGLVRADLFGRSVTATARQAVNRPPLYGGGSVGVSGRYHLACNLRRQEPLDVVLDAWSAFSSNFF